MSRQNKQLKRNKLAAEFQALHKAGKRGPGRGARPEHAKPRKKAAPEYGIMQLVWERIATRFGKDAVKDMVLR